MAPSGADAMISGRDQPRENGDADEIRPDRAQVLGDRRRVGSVRENNRNPSFARGRFHRRQAAYAGEAKERTAQPLARRL